MRPALLRLLEQIPLDGITYEALAAKTGLGVPYITDGISQLVHMGMVDREKIARPKKSYCDKNRGSRVLIRRMA